MDELDRQASRELFGRDDMAAAVLAAVQMQEMRSQIMALIEADKHRTEEIKELRAVLDVKLEQISNQLTALTRTATTWKGGFITLVALGGIIGWVVTVGGTVLKALGLT